MRLAVTDMPEHFPAQIADGQTMSVFPRVINLALNCDRNRRSIVTIDARDKAPLAPGTARLTAPAELDFSHLVRPGTDLAVRGGILRIHSADLAFDFRGAAPVAWEVRPTRPKPNQSRLSTGWIDAWSLFIDAPDPCGFAAALFADTQRSAFDRALARRVRATVPDFMRAGADTSLPDAWACLRRLLGVGLGLTPSGDDFSTGFFLGFERTSHEPGQRDFLHGLTRATLTQTHDSTDVSRACLTHAAAGRFSAPLTGLADGIVRHADNLPTRLANVLEMGHSSGRDAAFGVLCGLAVRNPDLRARVITQLNNAHMQEKSAR
jgi:hypothetical protein